MLYQQAKFSAINYQYQDTLRNYLLDEGEAPLHRAYEIGRNNLVNGMGLLEQTGLHQAAFAEVLKDRPENQLLLRRFNAANRFLNEVLSAFEVSRLNASDSENSRRELYDLVEAESNRIAQRLHDEASQMLAVVYLELAEISRNVPDYVSARIDGVVTHLDGICEQLRELSHELRPLSLDRWGLLPALRLLAKGFQKRTGTTVVVTGETGGVLCKAAELAIYRGVQEALTNVRRHAKASTVWIEITLSASAVCCTVRDDGAGFRMPVNESEVGLGLFGIHERLLSLKGSFVIKSAPGGGTELKMEIPL